MPRSSLKKLKKSAIALLEDLSGFCAREYKYGSRAFMEMRNAAPQELMWASEAIGLAVRVGATGSEFKFDQENLKLKEDSEVIVVSRVPGTDSEVKSKIESIDLTRGRVVLKGGAHLPSPCSIIADIFRENEAVAESIEAMIAAGDAPVSVVDILGKKLSVAAASNEELDDLEKRYGAAAKSIAHVLASVSAMDGGVMVIQGPPGSGKTYTSGLAIIDLIRQGKRVGIMARSHEAINNVAIKVCEFSRIFAVPFKGLKGAGDEEDHIKDSLFKNHANGDVRKKFADGDYSLIAGTTWLFPKILEVPLDYLFIDEAGQLSLAEVVAAARSAHNIVLVGDQQQLPHIANARHPGSAGDSVLEYLLGASGVVTPEQGFFLSQTRRMNGDLTAYISEVAYEGELSAEPGAEGRTFKALSTDPADPLGPLSLVLQFVRHDENGMSSTEEADVIKILVDRLAAAGQTDIMVIAPYRAQEALLRATLGPDYDAKIGTVDRFQGKEAEVVIFSMATSDPSLTSRDVDFLFSINRLNVAMSRARTKAILVCSPQLFEYRASDIKVMKLMNALFKTKRHHLHLLNEWRKKYA